MYRVVINLPVESHDNSIDMMVDASRVVPTFKEFLSENKQAYIEPLEQPLGASIDERFRLQWRGVCDTTKTAIPLVYNCSFSIPEYLPRLYPRSKLMIFVDQDITPELDSLLSFYRDPEYRPILFPQLQQLQKRGVYSIPVSRSSFFHMTESCADTSAFNCSDASVLRDVLNRRGWLRFTDKIAVVRLEKKSEDVLLLPTSVGALIEREYMTIQRIYTEEFALRSDLGEICDNGERPSRKRGVYLHPATELLSAELHSRRLGH